MYILFAGGHYDVGLGGAYKIKMTGSDLSKLKKEGLRLVKHDCDVDLWHIYDCETGEIHHGD